jgi:ferrochelatase
VVKGGDPYQFQCEQTAAAVVASLGVQNLDWTMCYQSRVGPLKWIGPSTDEEIRRAGLDKVPLIVAPIAFVSEHSETLVEIEIDYRKLAQDVGVPYFERIPTVAAGTYFIGALADLVAKASAKGSFSCTSGAGTRICPTTATCCPLTQ